MVGLGVGFSAGLQQVADALERVGSGQQGANGGVRAGFPPDAGVDGFRAAVRQKTRPLRSIASRLEGWTKAPPPAEIICPVPEHRSAMTWLPVPEGGLSVAGEDFINGASGAADDFVIGVAEGRPVRWDRRRPTWVLPVAMNPTR